MGGAVSLKLWGMQMLSIMGRWPGGKVVQVSSCKGIFYPEMTDHLPYVHVDRTMMVLEHHVWC